MSDCCDIFRFTDPGDGFSVGEGKVHIDVDSQLSGTSENPVQNKVIYNALQNIHIDVDDELSDSSENPVQNKVITQELADQKSVLDDLTALVDRKAGMLIDTASGAVASFTPDSTIDNLLGVTVDVEPVQDLHGYDHPWPAGGGKNKLDTSSFAGASYGGMKYERQDDGGIKISGTISTAASVYIVDGMSLTLPAGTYTLSGTGISQIYAYLLPGYRGGTFTLAEETTFTGFQIRQETVGYAADFTYYPQLELGSTATDYAPYSNECPISGWNAVGIEACGKNLLPDTVVWHANNISTFEGSDADGNDIRARTTPAFEFPFQGTFTISGLPSNVTSIVQVVCFDRFKNNIGTATVSGFTFTPRAGTAYIYILLGGTGFSTSRPSSATIQIEQNSTATAFKPFAGNTYTITLGQTVYGGTLDAVSGTMTVDRAIVAYADAIGFASHSSGRWYHNGLPSGEFHDRRAEAISNQAIYMDWQNVYAPYFSFGATGVYINKLSADETIKQFSARLSANPFQICYYLSTPITITLDPVTIATISEQANNVWADAGDVDVTYAADIKAYIDRLNQPTEDDMIANTLIAANKYFTVNNRLYISTASIAAGAQIIPGSNCVETNLAEALNALNV